MPAKERAQPIRTGAVDKLVAWVRSLPLRLTGCLANALLALAIVIAVLGILVFLTGHAGSVNRLLDSSLNIFGSPTYRPSTNPEVMVGMLQNFYPGMTVVIAIMAVVVPVVFVTVVVLVMASLGRAFLRLIASLFGRGVDRVAVMTVFVAWSVVVIVLWLILNIDNTVVYLLTSCGLMVTNLVLMTIYNQLQLGADREGNRR